MDYKALIIKRDIEFLLFRDFDIDCSYPIVKIYAYWDGQGISTETVSFENTDSAKAFIRDYTLESGKEWCEKNIVGNEKYNFPNSIDIFKE